MEKGREGKEAEKEKEKDKWNYIGKVWEKEEEMD